MKLTGKVMIIGDDYFEMYYTMEQGLSFHELENLDSTKWCKSGYLDSQDLWDKVTAIKLVNKNGEPIPGKFTTEVQVELKSDNSKNIISNGLVNEWGSRGYYRLSVDGSTVGGYNGTKVVVAATRYNVDIGEDIKDVASMQSDKVLSDDYDDTPATSDDTNIMFWIMLMCISIIGIPICAHRRAL
jgi:hypothetical protein